MKNRPLVSVIMPFYNTKPRFMHEAVQSVISQRYINWELLLIDDGSEFSSSELAISYSNRYPGKIKYLEHDKHENLGASASRQRGINTSRGKYIAFLDSDDVWLANKLEEQILIMENERAAGALYGNTMYWYSWTGLEIDAGRDMIPPLGVPPNTLFNPPILLPLYLTGKATVPSTCSLIVRKGFFDQFGGFESSFRFVYTDQVLYAKLALNVPIYVADNCWDWYRQHSESSVSTAKKTFQLTAARRYFLNWLNDYITEQDINDVDVRYAINRELWQLKYPDWLPKNENLRHIIRWLKKWFLKLGDQVAPASVQCILWKHN